MKNIVLLTNLGSPESCTASGIRRFLGEFLHDKRVIEIPRFIWCLILHGIILRVRPKKILPTYQAIWTDEGSPLIAISKHQAAKLQKKLGDDTKVILAMRYGEPSLKAALEQIKELRPEKLTILPMYPQYSATTTATTFDVIYKELKQWRYVPEMHFINGYYKHPTYIKALAEKIKTYWQEHHKPQKLIFSFHGLPKRNIKLGDAYESHCHGTANLLAKELGLSDDEWMTVFQSRFGAQEWLQPYCDKTLEELPKQGITEIQIACPGFPADCLETLFEIAEENKKVFMDNGGKQYSYIPALNDDDANIQLMEELVKNELVTV